MRIIRNTHDQTLKYLNFHKSIENESEMFIAIPNAESIHYMFTMIEVLTCWLFAIFLKKCAYLLRLVRFFCRFAVFTCDCFFLFTSAARVSLPISFFHSRFSSTSCAFIQIQNTTLCILWVNKIPTQKLLSYFDTQIICKIAKNDGLKNKRQQEKYVHTIDK